MTKMFAAFDKIQNTTKRRLRSKKAQAPFPIESWLKYYSNII